MQKSPKKSATTTTRHILNVKQISTVVHTNTIENTINKNKTLTIAINITHNITYKRIDLATLQHFEANVQYEIQKIEFLF